MGVRAGAAWATGAVYAASAVACCELAARTSAHFVDIRVYRMGGAAVLHGGDLYRLRLGTLPFTYPPFAAVVLSVLAVIPWRAAVTFLTAASAAALPVTLYLALRLPGPGGLIRPVAPAGRLAWPTALAVACTAIWLDPVRATLGYGQVDILLAAAVLYDLTRPDASRWKGTAIGLAAGIKLTPAIFVAYLLATRRYRAAATAAAVSAGSSPSRRWWWPGWWSVTPGGPGRRRPASARPGSRRSHSSAGSGWRRPLPALAGSPCRCLP